MVVVNFEREAGRQVERYNTPRLGRKEAMQMVGEEEREGVFANVCRTHLGALLFLARSTRPDLSEAVGSLAHCCNSWTTAADLRLFRIMGYVSATDNCGLVMIARTDLTAAELLLDSVSDADHGGCVKTFRSTSGWGVYLSDDAGSRWQRNHNGGSPRASGGAGKRGV